MRIYLDTEFLEGKQKKTFLGVTYGYTKPTIDLISIGLVREDGKELFLLSNEFNLREAWDRCDGVINEGFPPFRINYCIRENVLLPIYRKYITGDNRNRVSFSYQTMRYILDNWGVSLEQIAAEVKLFCYCETRTRVEIPTGQGISGYGGYRIDTQVTKPRFFGYYADYDWVVFCWLFGRMIDLPSSFPKLCYDIKQILDEKCKKLNITNVKDHADYPIQLEGVHDALEDAKWNKKLYEFTRGLTVWRSK